MSPTRVDLPELCLVLLVGPAGAGKSTLAASHFNPTEVVSLDHLRAAISDSPKDPAATEEATEVLHRIVDGRLHRGRLTVVDAPNLVRDETDPLLKIAKRRHVPVVALALDVKAKVCLERVLQGSAPDLGWGIDPRAMLRDELVSQLNAMRSTVSALRKRKGVEVFVLKALDPVADLQVRWVPLPGDHRDLAGPFDIIGDVHGCADELETLLQQLGYRLDPIQQVWRHPERIAVFVGDLVDRGPRCLDVFDLVQRMVRDGAGLCVLGNHDDKFNRYLSGRKVKIRHGLAQTVSELETLDPAAREEWTTAARTFLDSLPTQLRLDGGRLVVAHGGMREGLIGRVGGTVRAFALYGDTTGKLNAFGLPERRDWAREYRGRALVVYGHTPTLEPRWVNRTTNIDQGCCFGGALTALRYPEGSFVQVNARRTYCPPRGGFTPRVLPPRLVCSAELPFDPP